MQKNTEYYDNFYRKYPVNVHNSPARFSAVANLLRGKVLDCGCGTGTLADYYMGDYCGIDISDVAVSKARDVRRKDANFAVGDLTKKTKIEPADFDCAYIGEVLEHVEDDTVVFDNVLRALKKGARIVVTVPNGERVPDESHCRIFTVAQIRRDYSKYGKVRFYNWEGAERRILFTIDIDEPEQNNMSLVMIVKDEQKGIEKAILSALPLVDRVVISVDTKTQDNTAKIAEMYADELKFHEWKDDFSAARNFAQENVKSKWILFLDGHEYVESEADVREKMLFDVDGIFVTVRMESGMTFLYPRIYKSHIKFKNAVHNINECATRRVCKDFVIVHDRVNLQDGDAIERRNAQRDEMLPKEMQKAIEKNPKNVRAHFHLANYLMMRQKQKEAMRHYKKVVKFGKSVDEKYLSLVHIGAIHAAKANFLRAFLAFKKADRLMPNRWESARVMGGLFLMQGEFKNAVECFVEALTPNKRRYAYEPMQQNFAEIWDMIGHCFTKLDQNEKALIAFQQAAKNAKSEKQRDFFEQKAKLIKTLIPHCEEQQAQIEKPA